MHYLRLINQFGQASLKEETIHRANFWINLLHSLLNLVTGVLGLAIVFGQVETVRGWTFDGSLALLGVYLTVQAVRHLFIGPSLEALAGMDGEVWSGNLDFTLLRPVDIQFLASFRKWRLFSIIDLLLGLGVLVIAAARLEANLSLPQLAGFILALAAGMAILYAILLGFTALVFWSPGVLFTWLFNSAFQLARFPVSLYPGWLSLVLTWIIPVGLITTFPAQALTGTLPAPMLALSLAFATILVLTSSWFFHRALRRYASASS